MPTESTKHWLVIVHRKMRGPLTTAEIVLLLEQQVIRRNDIACEIDLDNKTKSTDWKLIWQFNEFDRRANQPKDEAQEKKREERRRDNPGKSPEETLREIPQELLDIDVSELIITPRNHLNQEFNLADSSRMAHEDATSSNPIKAYREYSWFYPTAGVFFLVVVGLKLWTPSQLKPQATQTPEVVALKLNPMVIQPPRKPATSILLPSASEITPTKESKHESDSEAAPVEEEPTSITRSKIRKQLPKAEIEEFLEQEDELNEGLADKGEIEMPLKKQTRKAKQEDLEEDEFPTEEERVPANQDADESESDGFYE